VATTVVAEAAEDNDNKIESNVVMVTAANDISTNDSSSGGDYDNGGSGDSDCNNKKIN
jgi:hypothetical protein